MRSLLRQARCIALIFYLIAAFYVRPATCEGEPTAPSEQLDFAHGLFQRSLYDMAVNEYKKFISSFPKNNDLHEAYFGIAESRFFSRSYEDAIEAYRVYIDRFPDGQKAALSNLRIGQSHFLEKDFDEALKVFLTVKAKDLEGKFVQVLRLYTGKAYKANGNNAKAMEYFKKITARPEGSEHAYYAFLEIGDIYREDSKYDMAVEQYDRAFKGSATDDIKSLALHKKGEALFASGDYASSSDAFMKVFKEYPDLGISAESLANLLSSLYNASRYDDIIAEFSKNRDAIGDKEKFFNAHYIVANAYAGLGRYDEALRKFDSILAFSPLSRERKEKALIRKVEVMLEAKRFNDAIGAIDGELKSIAPEEAFLMFMKAEAYYGLGDFAGAFAMYKEIVERYPDSRFSDFALYGMAFTMNSLGKDEEALERFLDYYKSGKDEKKRHEALYNAIGLEIKLGRRDEAIGHCGEYLAVFKDSDLIEKILFRLGTLYSETKQYDKAVDVFKDFMNRFRSSERLQEVNFLTGYNLQLAEKYDDALRYYRRVKPIRKEKKLYYSAIKNTALIYLSKEDNDTAAKVFDRIIMEFSDNDLGPDAYLWLAKYYLEKEDLDGVLRIMKTAESRQDIGKKADMAYFQAEAFRSKKDYAKAAEYYGRVLRTADEGAYKGASHIGKGLCMIELNDVDGAKKEFEAAILESPEDNTITMRARFELANMERLKKDHEAASKMYMLVTILYKDDHYCPESLFRAGESFEMLGRNEEALKVFQEIVDKYLESHRYEDAKERVEALSADQ
ncbi:tetratricopeptide repeat protein [Candidatus Omnitrophota bacterium]